MYDAPVNGNGLPSSRFPVEELFTRLVEFDRAKKELVSRVRDLPKVLAVYTILAIGTIPAVYALEKICYDKRCTVAISAGPLHFEFSYTETKRDGVAPQKNPSQNKPRFIDEVF